MKTALEKVGICIGKFLSVFPRMFKRMVVRIVGFSVFETNGKLSSMLYLVGYQIVKHMYVGSTVPEMFKKVIFENVTMQLDVAKKTQRILYFKKMYEPYVTNYVLKNLKRGDVFIDIGANVGIYTLLAAKLVGKEGKVFSFEPESNNYKILTQNIHLNHFENVIPVHKAVGEKNSVMMLNLNPLNEGGHSLIKFDEYHDDEEHWPQEKIKHQFPNAKLEEKVNVVTLDNFLSTSSHIKTPKIIKIDIEGAELAALKGMLGLLTKADAPELMCEVSRDASEILTFLSGYNYKAYLLDEQGIPHLYEGNLMKTKAVLFSKRSI